MDQIQTQLMNGLSVVCRLHPTILPSPNMTESKTPPQPPPTWSHTAEEIIALTEKALTNHQNLLDNITALSASAQNFSSVFAALALGEAELDTETGPLTFYQRVSADEKVRNASREAEKRIKDHREESSRRQDIFRTQQNAYKNITDSGQELLPEEKWLVDRMLLDGERAGADLESPQWDNLKELKESLSANCSKINDNVDNESGTITFTEDELAGIPPEFEGNWVQAPDGTYIVRHKPLQIFPIFEYADKPATRQRAFESYESRLKTNQELLRTALEERRRIVDILGYKTWADYVTHVNMVKTAEAVNSFLSELATDLNKQGTTDRDNLLVLKRENENEDPCDEELYLWDFRYYDRKFINKNTPISENPRDYFPAERVVERIRKIYEDLSGVTFEEISGNETWRSDVKLFAVWKKNEEVNEFIGYCYFDLYGRPNPPEPEPPHVSTLIPGYKHSGNDRKYPVVALVPNLKNTATQNKPVFMRHNDVVSFFREMGHVLHGLLSRTEFSRFHGASVAGDFVRAPGLMFENWAWNSDVLKKISSHYSTGNSLSDALIKQIIARYPTTRYVNVGLFYLRQLYLGTFDFRVHTDDGTTDLTELWNELRETISLVKADVNNPLPGHTQFRHLTRGYDAAYYGHMHSFFLAANMFETGFGGNPFDSKAGSNFVELVLKPGGSREAAALVKDFLKGDPKLETFLKHLGVQVA
ncbi:hypothetical protein JAAARDRAFT_189709 [Jaapia argillacea MUCL 33604]|uniref:Peptidase M3A/M3B catalytic domain-containing protein n=1 Tax=Jaapia argillacea MUCL 33604 TaxID=933084 RepID=A0A067Q8A2_9AGAM|nr:hypothetical protein JAAARDRAFT_189709 [Jaapia argillacea MUCL 33604]